jgi:hypothetical protein
LQKVSSQPLYFLEILGIFDIEEENVMSCPEIRLFPGGHIFLKGFYGDLKTLTEA